MSPWLMKMMDEFVSSDNSWRYSDMWHDFLFAAEEGGHPHLRGLIPWLGGGGHLHLAVQECRGWCVC